MSTINLSVLTRPFPKHQIRQRKGRKGKTLDYVATHAVISRLNEASHGLYFSCALAHVTAPVDDSGKERVDRIARHGGYLWWKYVIRSTRRISFYSSSFSSYPATFSMSAW